MNAHIEALEGELACLREATRIRMTTEELPATRARVLGFYVMFWTNQRSIWMPVTCFHHPSGLPVWQDDHGDLIAQPSAWVPMPRPLAEGREIPALSEADREHFRNTWRRRNYGSD